MYPSFTPHCTVSGNLPDPGYLKSHDDDLAHQPHSSTSFVEPLIHHRLASLQATYPSSTTLSTRMRVSAFLPLALVPLASASLATDAYKWANELVSSNDAQASKLGEVHTMDSWSYVDCGMFLDRFEYEADVDRTTNRCCVCSTMTRS